MFHTAGRLGLRLNIFALLLIAVSTCPGESSALTPCFLCVHSVKGLRSYAVSRPMEFCQHMHAVGQELLQRVPVCVHGTMGGNLANGKQEPKVLCVCACLLIPLFCCCSLTVVVAHGRCS